MRLHLFEFNDQSWVPAVLRDASTAYLDMALRTVGFDRRMAPVVDRALMDSGMGRIIDLGSGNGGVIKRIQAHLTRPIPVVLTDKFPNRTAFHAAARGLVSARFDSIDATRVPPELAGLRTLINTFHHFRPDDARRILADAATQRMPLVVLEGSERTTRNVLGSLLIVPMVLVLMPFVRPLRWQYLLYTYLIPILPLMIFWDGLVSHLRTYSAPELEEMVGEIGDPSYLWKVQLVGLGGGLRGTALAGQPLDAARDIS